MRRSTFLLVPMMGLAVTACSYVTSVEPVGDKPVYLEPKKWEGLWKYDREENDEIMVETLAVNVVDAAGGILEFRRPEDCTHKAGQAIVRQHTHADSQASFISTKSDQGYFRENPDRGNRDFDDYIWAKYGRLGNALIVYLPHVGSFHKLVYRGEMPGKVNGDDVLLEQLSNDQLNRITTDKEQQLFFYELKDMSVFPGFYRVSPILADGRMRCTPHAKPGEGSSESATGEIPAANFAITELAQTFPEKGLVINNPVEVVAAGIGVIVGRNAFGKRAIFLDPGHGVTDLGTLGGEWSHANALNDLDQVVGQSETANGQSHAFLWEGGVMTDLGLSADESSAQAISKSGQVVGGWRIKSKEGVESPRTAFLWTRSGGMTDLGTLGGVDSEANSINDRGGVVGRSKTVQGYNRAFLFHTDTGMVDLGTLGGRDSAAASINNAGQVVGWSEITWGDTQQRRAFLWDHGKMIDLSSLPEVKEAGWLELTEAVEINDQGQIVGFGVHEGKDRVFLLTPAPPVANGL
jgi:probable HAF family extracellular repeat protein